MKEFSVKEKLMGTKFTLGVVSESSMKAHDLLWTGIEEIKRIENLLSEFLPHSETTRINDNAALKPIEVSDECFDLLSRSISISSLTKGDFDITASPLKKIYQFKNKYFRPPKKSVIKRVLEGVGYEKIKLNPENRSIFLTHSSSKISFAAIGKGYASDSVKKIWIKSGVASGYINASGDLNAFGQKADGSPWKVGIANPDDENKTLLFVPLNNCSIATSGDYEQHFIYNNTRFSHNINPHTGLPITGIKSVTVFSPSAELSDALATAVCVKGVEKGVIFVNQLPDTHCIVIDDKNKLYFSNKLRYEKIDF